jgi:hypothetical protein
LPFEKSITLEGKKKEKTPEIPLFWAIVDTLEQMFHDHSRHIEEAGL